MLIQSAGGRCSEQVAGSRCSEQGAVKLKLSFGIGCLVLIFDKI